MLNRLQGDTKILHGNDTDASVTTIVRVCDEFAVMMTCIDEQGKTFSTASNWDFDQFRKEFARQDGAPMMYIRKEDFEWMMQ